MSGNTANHMDQTRSVARFVSAVATAVSREELDLVRAELRYHPWSTASDTDSWTASGDLDSFLDLALEKCGIYDATQRSWDLGSDLNGPSLVRAFHRLFVVLLSMWDSKGMYIVSQNLDNVDSMSTFDKPHPLLIFARKPHPAMATDYQTCIVPVEVLWKTNQDLSDNLKIQLGVYSRRCFLSRPERHSVCCLVLTKRSANVFVFDRNGYHLTRAIDIHLQPKLFIYIFFCLSQPDRSVDHIFWRQGIRYLSLTDASTAEAHTFQVEKTCLSGHNPFGRATAAWMVRNGVGKRFVVKRAWDYRSPRAEYFETEGMILAKVRGVAGVGQVAAYTQGTTGYINEALYNIPHSSQFHNAFLTDIDPIKRVMYARIHNVVVMEYYERNISKFMTTRELLRVLRDAIEGHRNLWELGVCHRDICPKNIRIKGEGDNIRGVLVGLDKAKPVGTPTTVLPCMPDVAPGPGLAGKNLFQSIYVLEVSRSPLTDAFPSYLDELESFFYILCILCSMYGDRSKDLPEREHSEVASWCRHWSSPDPEVFVHAKKVFIRKHLQDHFVAPCFGPVFVDLLRNLRDIVCKNHEKRMTAWETFSGKTTPVPEPITSEGYREFLACINRAIDQT